MLYRLGRLLQLLGMIILPIAIAGNLARQNEIDEKTMLGMAAVGIIIFIVGWMIQKNARP